MAHAASPSFARQLGSLFEGGSAAGLSDRELLERFTARAAPADEAAFAAIVARHGPMVLGVCQQLLGDHHHAEDAFQATFFVLARQAHSIRDPDRLGTWLYGVALRTARKASGRLARRRRTEEERAGRGSALDPAVPADQALLDREQAEALHGEIDRLPGAFRLPVVLCYFEGLTLDEAAERLRWPVGTLRSRLARAREKLRRGLSRRGFALSTTAMTPRSAPASVSSLLCDSTTRAAIAFAGHKAAGAAISAPAAALAQGVLRTMLFHKLRSVFLTMLILTAVATGAGYYGLNALARAPQREPDAKAASKKGTPSGGQARTEPRRPDQPRPPGPPADRMTFAGQVVDWYGKPVVGAAVDLVGRPRRRLPDGTVVIGRAVLLGRGTSGAQGRFRIEAARTSRSTFVGVHALALAPGFGPGWTSFEPNSGRPAAEVRLRPEQVLRGQLVDLAGRPAAGVEIQVDDMSLPGRFSVDLTSTEERPLDGLLAWPRPVKTDDQGRFTIPGVGRWLRVHLVSRDPRFARQWLEPDDRDGPREITLALQPPFEGRVLAADTGQPISGAVLQVEASRAGVTGITLSRIQADGQGRFRADPFQADQFVVNVYPPDGLPYRCVRQEFDRRKGAVKEEIDFRLPRGALIRGKVTEQTTGRPMARATIQYISMKGPDGEPSRDQTVMATDDGTYQIVVPPGKGHLLVFGSTHDYLLEVIGRRMLSDGQPGGARTYAHKIIPYEARSVDQPHQIDAVLRPGRTIKGRVIGPNGQPVDLASMTTRLYVKDSSPSWPGAGMFQPYARDGRFELHGLDPVLSAPVYFLDADHEWGAILEASGKMAGEDLTVRLQPCGQARARLVGPDGRPVVRAQPWVEIVVTPGAREFGAGPADRGQLQADAAQLSIIDRRHYREKQRPLTDAQGRVTLPALIPGASYRLMDRSDPSKGDQVRKDFTVKPGETLDLGDILIDKPPG